MTQRGKPPVGAPTWADLTTSDVEGSREFYQRVLGWEPAEPSPEFGGYFMFLRDGVPVAGGSGQMPGTTAPDAWKIYLAVDDMATTVASAEAHGAHVGSPAMPVADLGVQAVIADPTGAVVGVWQPGTFPGFTVLEEPGAPSWFELQTRDHDGAVSFYRDVFAWDTVVLPGAPELTYTSMRDPAAEGRVLAGIMDASAFLPDGVPASWSVYWAVADVDATVRTAEAAGGSVLMAPEDTPYGKLAALADPTGAVFKLRSV